jgi:hypothetical protein
MPEHVPCICEAVLFPEPGTGEVTCGKCDRTFIRFGRRWVLQKAPHAQH